MAASFYFYDLETSGFRPSQARIMQFAGQRTDMDFKPIGEQLNVLIKMVSDTVPDPEAVLVTGITPQQTIADGISEAEFLKQFYHVAVKPDTIFVGFNNIRFDDEFMRFTNYRSFYDAYEWQWKDGNSRWDLLDVARMTRALKPDGIKWPFAADGKPTNRLEYLSSINKLEHTAAHDAMSDVMATIYLAQLIKSKQPQLFNYLLEYRSKAKVRSLVESGKPFMYTSGSFSSQFLHTTAALFLGRRDQQDYALVYDLRIDPTPFLKLTVNEIIDAWKFTRDPEAVRLPVKTLKYNRCPAVIPGVVKDKDTLARLRLTRQQILDNAVQVTKHSKSFVAKLFQAVERLDEERALVQTVIIEDDLSVDDRLYDGFMTNKDKILMTKLRQTDPIELNNYFSKFDDRRLNSLLLLYKARNFPHSLNSEELAYWDEFRIKKLLNGGTDSRLAKYFDRINELAETSLSGEKQYLLEELKLYGESIMPVD
ncbi:MAG TPA: exodeoxyribonuclease I [Candidatus Saccharimonadales bacterium]|nr:exodeoxyribonuclease I [Candidatus Saccharimonadales bacterium]